MYHTTVVEFDCFYSLRAMISGVDMRSEQCQVQHCALCKFSTRG